jgi:general secretion pathway protein N
LKLLTPFLALVLLLLLLVAKLPASWLDYAVRTASRGTLTMTSTQGTLWRGSGTLQAILPSAEVHTLDKLDWRVDARALLKAGLRIEFQRTGDARTVVSAFAGLGGWSLDKLDLHFPANLLGAFSRTLAQLGLSGQVQVNLDGVSEDAGRLKGEGQVLWQEAGSTVTRVHPLGNYRVELQGKGEALEFRLMTLGGKLDLHGAGSWRPGAGATFTGEAAPQAAHREELAPLLRMLGKDTGGGAYTLVLDAATGLSAR